MVSVPMVLNLLVVPPTRGAASERTAGLARAWSRTRRAAVSGSTSLGLADPSGRRLGAALRSALSWPRTGPADSSKAWRENGVRPLPCPVWISSVGTPAFLSLLHRAGEVIGNEVQR